MSFSSPTVKRETLALLTGSDPAVKAIMNGREVSEISLRGAGPAINTALRQCSGGATTSRTSAGSPGGWTKVSFPPLPQGTYAWSMPCAQAAREPDFPPLMRLTARSWSEMDGASPILSIESNGPSRYRFSLESEDEAGRKSRNYTEIRIIDATSFESNGRTLRHCPVDYGARLGL